MPQLRVRVVTSGATTTLTTNSGHVSQIVMATRAPGTTWTVEVRDKDTNPRTLFGPIPVTAPTPAIPMIVFAPKNSILAVGGIDIVTTGTAGEAHLWIDINQGINE